MLMQWLRAHGRAPRGVGRASLGCLAIALIGAAASAEETKPAVSELNAKIGINLGHGEVEGDRTRGFVWFGQGALTIPVGRPFGIQLEAAAGTFDGKFFRGAGAHAFWRDPDIGLLGGTFQYQGLAGADLYRFGGEGEFYWRWLTIGASVGYQSGSPNQSKTIRPGQGAYGLLDLRVYPVGNLMLHAGGGFAPLRNDDYQGLIRFGAEYQPGYRSLPGLTYFVEGDVGTRNHHVITAGVRLYFGLGSGFNAKPLVRRHREDDPVWLTPLGLQGFQNGLTNTLPTSTGCPSGQISDGEGGCIPEESMNPE